MQQSFVDTEGALVAPGRTGCVLSNQMVGERCRIGCLIERLVEDSRRADLGKPGGVHVSRARSPEAAESKSEPLDRSSQALESRPTSAFLLPCVALAVYAAAVGLLFYDFSHEVVDALPDLGSFVYFLQQFSV
jgi:hypothetical protein